MREATQDVIDLAASDPELIGSIAHHYLQWVGLLVGGWQWALAAGRAAGQARSENVTDEAARTEAQATIDTAGFYAAHIMPRALTHEVIVRQGSLPVTAATIANI